VTLIETKLDAYTTEFRVIQTNFDEKITNTVDNATNKALQGVTDSIEIETNRTESILIKIKKKILRVKIPPKILTSISKFDQDGETKRDKTHW